MSINSPTAVVVGNFDGLHIGHMKLINVMKRVAQDKGLRTAVVSFLPHPLVYFGKVKQLETILTLEEKKGILKQHGIDYYIELQFDKVLAEMAPAEFFNKVLIEKLNCATFIVGEDYRFGKAREGDVEIARKLCAEHGVNSEVVPAEKCRNIGEKISSSHIRALIAGGKLNEATELLGYDYLTIKKKP